MVSSEKLPLSVVIVAKNEAHNLPRCLASVHGWVDEIVVALNATTDDSAAVAEKFGARVAHLPWQGYRDTKNAALALAQHNWVLSLDADEEVSPALRDAITAFAGDFDQFSGARFPRKVWFIDRAGQPGAAGYLAGRLLVNLLKAAGFAVLSGLQAVILRPGAAKKALVRAWRSCGYVYQTFRSLTARSP